MRKRLLAALLAAAMMVSLVACGSADKPSNSADPSGSGSPASQESGEIQNNTNTVVYRGNGHEPYEPNPDAVSTKDTLVFSVPVDPKSISSMISENDSVYIINSMVGNTLLELVGDGNGGITVAVTDDSLATAYEFDDDNLGVTFQLREGVKFCDGTEFTAEDVIFSLLYRRTRSTLSAIDFDNITADGKYTVHVPLKTADSTLFKSIVTSYMFSKAAYEAAGGPDGEGKFFTSGYVSTGPYMVTEWSSGDHISMKANPNYFAGTPKIENVILRIIPEASVAMMELETGGVDVIWKPAWTDTKNVIEGAYGEDIAYWTAASAMLVHLGFNCSADSPCEDLRVRQAICYAIDRDILALGAYEGLGEVANTIFSNGFENMHNMKDNWPYPHDVEKAKALLKEAGYENGLELTIIHNGDANRVLACEILVNQLAEAGITLKVQGYDSATCNEMCANETTTWDMWIRTFGGSGVAPTIILRRTIADNSHCQADPAYADLVELGEKLYGTMDTDERNGYSDELQERFLNEWLYIYPLVQNTEHVLMNSRLKGCTVAEYTWNLTEAYFD